jgi:NAD(P)-dependent dehydrogenase (short-subunit alcohol dehydrogenase family)
MLADRGARVLIADRGVSAAGVGVDPGPAGEVVDEIGARRGSAAAYLADLSTEAGAVGAVDTTLEAFGRIDGIVHNASTAPEMEPIQRPRPSAYVRCQQIAKVTRSVW